MFHGVGGWGSYVGRDLIPTEQLRRASPPGNGRPNPGTRNFNFRFSLIFPPMYTKPSLNLHQNDPRHEIHPMHPLWSVDTAYGPNYAKEINHTHISQPDRNVRDACKWREAAGRGSDAPGPHQSIPPPALPLKYTTSN